MTQPEYVYAIKNKDGLFFSGHSYDDDTDKTTHYWSESIEDARLYIPRIGAYWANMAILDSEGRVEKIPYELIPE